MAAAAWLSPLLDLPLPPSQIQGGRGGDGSHSRRSAEPSSLPHSPSQNLTLDPTPEEGAGESGGDVFFVR